MKSEEGSDSLDTFIRHAVGKEPMFQFSRTTDNPLQWIQLLHTIDQPDLAGWPLLAPVKIQMQKCEKCAREFCSSINYRRHIKVHRRSMNFHKESQKYRDLLGTFWDKLSYDEAKEIVSFKDVNLEDVSGSTIVNTIAAILRKSSFLSFPQLYVKAGSALVDIIEGRGSISWEKLFSVLDDASERTFLCAGTAESLHKYVFDGEAAKVGLEMRNVVACTSFLLEQKLVKAWLLDKDAEALRCEKLLVEEEEAAQRRQAELLERKKRRKIRQRERSGVKLDSCMTTSSSAQDSNSIPPITPLELSNNEEIVAQQHVNASHHAIARWQLPRPRNGKWEHAHKHREQQRGKIWTRKPKSEEVVKSRVQSNNCQLMIGSISVTLRNSNNRELENSNTQVKTKSHNNGKFWRVRRSVGVESEEKSNVHVEKVERTPFCIDAAKAFLSQRWKEAISGEHVELVVTSSPRDKAQVKPKFRTNPIKTKYIPKQRAVY